MFRGIFATFDDLSILKVFGMKLTLFFLGIRDSPDIDPSSLEWLLLLLLSVVILLLLLFSIDDGAIADVGDVFSSTSWSSLQYSVPPSLKANSSPFF